MAESHGEAKGQKTGAHTEADGGHGGAFPPFDSSTFASQLVSLVIAFVALYLIVSRIALPRVGSVIDARQNVIEGDLAEAQKLKDESDAALKAYENELAAARARAHAISAETREKLNAASEAERKTLERRSERIKAELDDARRLKEEAAKVLAEYEARRASAEREAEDIIANARAEAERIAGEAKAKIEDFVARRTKTAEGKIALAEAQALADVRAAAADAAVAAASTILSQSVKGEIADELLAKGIAEVRAKLN